jgi:hypothetical protein
MTPWSKNANPYITQNQDRNMALSKKGYEDKVTKEINDILNKRRPLYYGLDWPCVEREIKETFVENHLPMNEIYVKKVTYLEDAIYEAKREHDRLYPEYERLMLYSDDNDLPLQDSHRDLLIFNPFGKHSSPKEMIHKLYYDHFYELINRCVNQCLVDYLRKRLWTLDKGVSWDKPW